jgi:predicted enzyme related to lactoylglutathione lyase
MNLCVNDFNIKKYRMFNKLRTVVYHVSDLEKAKDWYSKVTGKPPYFDMPFYVGFDINGCELGLDPDMTGVTDGNHAFAYWSVDNIEDCLTQLITAGAVLTNPIQEVGEGTRVAVVNDPWGNAVGLIEEA